MAITYTIPIFYGKAYPEGPRVSPAQNLFPDVPGGTFALLPISWQGSFDFTNSGMSGLQSVEIDNSANNQPIILIVADTGQQIVTPPNSIKTAPLYTGQLAFQARFVTAYQGVAPPMSIRFFNMPQDFATRQGYAIVNAGGTPALIYPGSQVPYLGGSVKFFEYDFNLGPLVTSIPILPAVVLPLQYVVTAISATVANLYNAPFKSADTVIINIWDTVNMIRTWDVQVPQSIKDMSGIIVCDETGLNIPVQNITLTATSFNGVLTSRGAMILNITYALVTL